MIYVMIANEAIYKRTDMKMKALKKTKHKQRFEHYSNIQAFSVF